MDLSINQPKGSNAMQQQLNSIYPSPLVQAEADIESSPSHQTPPHKHIDSTSQSHSGAVPHGMTSMPSKEVHVIDGVTPPSPISPLFKDSKLAATPYSPRLSHGQQDDRTIDSILFPNGSREKQTASLFAEDTGTTSSVTKSRKPQEHKQERSTGESKQQEKARAERKFKRNNRLLLQTNVRPWIYPESLVTNPEWYVEREMAWMKDIGAVYSKSRDTTKRTRADKVASDIQTTKRLRKTHTVVQNVPEPFTVRGTAQRSLATESSTESAAAPMAATRPPKRQRPAADDLHELDQVSAKKHKRNTSSISAMDNKIEPDFDSVPDYSPSIRSMLDNRNLRVDWKGTPVDLSRDPNISLLAAQEVHLASTLRLTCAQYLYAKRRIFERFVEDQKRGKTFNKTAAQAVCQIDVNKASKLWTAFDRVGWFDRHHFTQLLNA